MLMLTQQHVQQKQAANILTELPNISDILQHTNTCTCTFATALPCKLLHRPKLSNWVVRSVAMSQAKLVTKMPQPSA
jgi:hypothetical protein